MIIASLVVTEALVYLLSDWLPDDCTVGGIEPHLVTRLDTEGIEEGVDVAQGGIDAVLAK